MKKLLSGLMSVALFSLLFMTTNVPKAAAQDVSVSYQDFYDNLAPYGQWVDDPQYGNVWVPNEEGDFRPYGTRGHWVMTDYGNTWVSDDPWGWACYHYGRWTYDSYYGWIWIPGYEWAPAWVSWRYGGGYCGWAPLGPGFTITSYNCPDSWWVFVGPEHMYEHDCIHYWRGPSYNNTCIRRTNVMNNYYLDNRTHVHYNYGPRADVIQRDTHQPVQVYRVSQTTRPGAPSVSGNRVSMYRPTVNRTSVNTAHPTNVITAPRRIGAPQAATNTSPGRQPQFRQEVQRRAPQAEPQRGAPQAQPQRGAPQPQRGAPQAQPQRGAPQPQRGTPQTQPQPQRGAPQRQMPQPQRQAPQPQPQRQAPQPQRQAPQPQPQRQMPQPQRQAPQPQPQRQMPEPQRQAPQPQPQRQMPQPQRQAPQPQPQRQMPQQQPQRQMPQQQPQRQMPQPQRQMPQQQPQRQAPQPQHEQGGRR